MRILKAGALYFVLVFGAGFLLGLIRVPLLVPRLGVRTAELLEMPVMLVAIVWAARHCARRFALPSTGVDRLAAGSLAFVLLVAAELTFAALAQGQSPAAYIASRDPVSGAAYAVALVLFALMPFLLARRHGPVPFR